MIGQQERLKAVGHQLIVKKASVKLKMLGTTMVCMSHYIRSRRCALMSGKQHPCFVLYMQYWLSAMNKHPAFDQEALNNLIEIVGKKSGRIKRHGSLFN
ncbi:MAG: hypothetical protein NG747_13195 [Candidatus Brocadia sp.]|nr:hypothetical protein [Candidatus Brocadia sp.]